MILKDTRYFLGIIVANAVAAAVMVLDRYLHQKFGIGTALGYITFFLIPLVMGMICCYFWEPLKMRTIYVLLSLFLVLLIGCFLSAFFIGEGYICLIIMSPLVLGIMVMGYYLFRYGKRRNNMKVSIAGLLFLIILADITQTKVHETAVSDVMLIKAPPARVWPYVVSIPEMKERSHYWLFSIGMPRPVASTVSAYAKDADRKCIFSNGVVFDEKMVVYEPGKELTFDIVKQPADPEILGHIDIKRGQFLLHDNGDGTTTLTGTSWYALHVYPASYFDIWARSITRNVHIRAMEHIKMLSER